MSNARGHPVCSQGAPHCDHECRARSIEPSALRWAHYRNSIDSLTPSCAVVVKEAEGGDPDLAQASQCATPQIAGAKEHQVGRVAIPGFVKGRCFSLLSTFDSFG